MLSSWESAAVLLAGLTTYQIYGAAVGLRKNIKIAKSTGFPYVIAPWSPWWIPGQVTGKLWRPIVTLLPPSWWENWLE
jgi:hypothetical protein